MTALEQSFYAQIGMISIEFAKLESLIRDIICLLINPDDEFVTQLVIQENSISQNQKLLSQLNKYKSIEEEGIKHLNKKIDKLRINRNLFIHGVWSIFQKEGNPEPKYICSTKRVHFKDGPYGRVTIRNTHDKFSFTDLEKESSDIIECVRIASELFNKIEKDF